jgi:uncharacterized protein YcgL (UPF0745 family)
MSSINVKDLHRMQNKKDKKRQEIFEKILKKIYIRIQQHAKREDTGCFYSVPEFQMGVPLYDLRLCIDYIKSSLERQGFYIKFTPPNLLYISWKEQHNENRKSSSSSSYDTSSVRSFDTTSILQKYKLIKK